MPVEPDPAAVLACAMSLHDACVAFAKAAPSVNLNTAYHGGDEFLRQMMRVGSLFETWAGEHVVFEHLTDPWPYLLQDRFGPACLEVMGAGQFGHFGEDDCLRVALGLRLPLRADGTLPVPVLVEAENPLHGAGFSRLRIQTWRKEVGEDGGICPYGEGDDPLDEEFGPPFSAVYGVRGDGRAEYLTDMVSYREAREWLVDLLPGIGLPESVATGAC